ncbi:MAG: T9SS type A sorting domain-containing protein, partial [Bacteroidales bacterium]|nr:T9SS type A sorting domain-containing protein [Bacteroidales bacterium]
KWDAPEERTPIAYNIYVDGMFLEENYDLDTYYSNEEIVEIIMPLEYRGHTAEVVAVYEGGMTSVGTIKLIDDDWDGIEETEKVAFNIYPNPANDFVKLSAVGAQLSVVKVYNCLGMLIEEIEVNSSEVEVNTSDYETGVYFVTVEGRDFVKTERLVIFK